MHASKIITIFSHIVGWLIILSLPLLFITQQAGGLSITSLLVSVEYWMFNLSSIGLFYLHVYWIYPKLYANKKYLWYTVALLILFVGFTYLRPFDRLMGSTNKTPDFERPERKPFSPSLRDFHRNNIPPSDRGDGRPFDVVSAFLFLLIIAMGIAIETAHRLMLTEKQVLQAEKDKVNAELSFLKAQINPHFLFNTLNNIYSLASTESEHTADSIMKLSNIMRYVTDDASENLVPLESEVACIQDYIDLQRLRLSSKVEVSYSAEGKMEKKSVPPMILMTFVENAFKYGISNHEPATITIKLVVRENNIEFFSRNKLFKTARHTVSTGVGLTNTRQRLDYMYPNKHLLKIDQDNGFFSIHLTLFT